jgi:hypothetical protein
MSFDDSNADAAMGGAAICQACGHDTRLESVELKEEDRREYVRCVLGRRQFTKEYTFLDGAVKAVFGDCALSAQTAADQLARELRKERPSIPASLIRCAIAMRELSMGGESRIWEGTPKDIQEMGDRVDYLDSSLPMTLIPSVTAAYTLFCQTLIGLSERGLDRNF